MKKKYKKDITLEYKYEDSPESEKALEELFDKLFSKIIQGRKKMNAYYKSDLYKKDYEYLSKRKSILTDFLPIP